MALSTSQSMNNWRLSQIAEELESLDLSLDMEAELQKIGNFSPDLSSNSETIYSSTDVAGPKSDKIVNSNSNGGYSVGYVNFTKDIPKKEEKKPSPNQYAKVRGGRVRVMPNCPPPPPPIPVTSQPPVMSPVPESPSSSETSLDSPPISSFASSMPSYPTGKYTTGVREAIEFTPKSSSTFVSSIPVSTVVGKYSQRTRAPTARIKAKAPAPPSPLHVMPPVIHPYLPNNIDSDLPPPPLFALQEPIFAPPSPVTSPLFINNDAPNFGLISSEPKITSLPEVYAPTSVASTSSDHRSELSDESDMTLFEKVSDDDIQQVEMFFRSHKAQVYVCPGLANLYFGPARPDGISGEKWELYKTGIPVLLMDSGDARRQRKIKIILAEKGSGFILWKDSLDQLSNFKSVHSNFQSMFLSNDHTKLAGLSYDDESAANEFLTTLQDFTSDPNDEAMRMGRKKKKLKKQKYKAPKKSDISQPCGFIHVTKLDRHDHDQYVEQVSSTTPVLSTRNEHALDVRPNGFAK